MSGAIRFIGGNPSPEDVAAVVAVLTAQAAAGAAASSAPEPARSMWGRPAHARQARPRSWAEARLPR